MAQNFLPVMLAGDGDHEPILQQLSVGLFIFDVEVDDVGGFSDDASRLGDQIILLVCGSDIECICIAAGSPGGNINFEDSGLGEGPTHEHDMFGGIQPDVFFLHVVIMFNY